MQIFPRAVIGKNTPVRIRGLASAGFIHKGLVAFTHEKPVKQSRTLWSFPTMASTCLSSVEKFLPISLIREMRRYRVKAVKPDKIILIIVSSVSIVNMPANLENRTGKGQFSFHKERQCQRMLKLLHSCTHLTR